MKLIDGKIFDRVKPQLVMDYLKNLDIKIIEIDPRDVKVIRVDEGILKLEVNSQRKEFYSIRKSFLFKLLKWFNISHHNIDHFNIDTIIAICNDNLKAISDNSYHSYIKIKIENDDAVSILSSKFTIINDLEIIDLAQKYNIDKISRDDFSLRIYTTIKENSEPIVGDRFGYGFNITNSETGFSPVKAEHFILRYWCTNGATSKITTNNHSFNHYKMDKNLVRDSIMDILDNSESISNLFDEKVRNAQKIKAALFFPNIQYQISNIIGSSQGFKFFYDFDKKNKTKYDLFNYITDKAKRFNLLEKYLLEQLGGSIM